MKETQTKLNNRKISEKGVSEAVGFLIIFSIVMIGISIITLYGYPMLLEQKSIANVRNVERDMIVIQNDIKSLAYKNVPYKETSLQVSGGALQVKSYTNPTANSSSMKITYNGDEYDEYLGQLRFDSDSTDDIIILENGAVLTRQRFQSGSAMLSEPRWFIDNRIEDNNDENKTFVINIIKINSSSEPSKIGVMTIQMKGDYELIKDLSDPGTITVTYNYTQNTESDFSTAWENYFKTLNMSFVSSGGGKIEYKADDIDRLVIKQFEVEILNI